MYVGSSSAHHGTLADGQRTQAKSFGYYTVSARLYDQNFERYNVSSVVRPDFTLDEEKCALPSSNPPYTDAHDSILTGLQLSGPSS